MVVSVMAVALLALACDVSSEQLKQQAIGVAIERISPTSAELGEELTIYGSGFTANNDVGFENQQIDFQGSHVGYLSGLASEDGESLRVALPDNGDRLLGACAMSQLKANEACPSIGLLLPSGTGRVFVVNDGGESNRVTLEVVAAATPASLP
jgi:hypothetical protein